MLRSLLLCTLLALALAACGSSAHNGDDDDDTSDGEICSDPDSDGYGEGDGCLGDDCDENNPNVHDCGDCGDSGDEHNTGCACDALQPEVCYEGTEGTAGTGACASGLRSCRDGVWSGCEGQVIDEAETCDYEDNDCDGENDNGVLGPCGDCSDDCSAITWGPDGTPFDPDTNGSGVVGTAEGWITLSQNSISSHLIWIANSVDGTISKFDTRTREELARYRTGPLGSSFGMWDGNGDNPSRTSVNFFGDAYVANRAFTGIASATKILADFCPDNGDGLVNTSTGGDDVLDWDPDDGPDDDCIAWNTPAGNLGDLGRSIASQVRAELDGGSHEYVWLGLFNQRKYVEIDGETGELTGEEAQFGALTPYGAAIDADGNLWSASLGGYIGRFDTADPTDVEEFLDPAGFNYGITVDSFGNVWVNGAAVERYRPADEEWDLVVGARYENGGIAVDGDGIVWTHHDSGMIQRIDSNDPDLPLTEIDSGRGGRGVAVDSDGYIWAINWDDASGNDGDVTIIDPDDPENYSSCCDSINNSYTYSDMTGVQLGIATAPSGTYEFVAEGCEAPLATTWVGFDYEGDLPGETGIRVEVRSAATLPELATADWRLAGTIPPDESPLDMRDIFTDEESAYYLGVRLTLLSFDRDALPVVHNVSIQRSCFNPFG